MFLRRGAEYFFIPRFFLRRICNHSRKNFRKKFRLYFFPHAALLKIFYRRKEKFLQSCSTDTLTHNTLCELVSRELQEKSIRIQFPFKNPTCQVEKSQTTVYCMFNIDEHRVFSNEHGDFMAIYFDCNATTPMAPEVFEAMHTFFLEEYGNPGSRTHEYGNRAKKGVEAARRET